MTRKLDDETITNNIPCLIQIETKEKVMVSSLVLLAITPVGFKVTNIIDIRR